ncbi:MAG: hypothetical protein WCD81_05580 [Candidatus Bathyarchaeia archaeon]
MHEDIVSYFRRITKLEPIPEQIEVLEALANFDIKNLALCAGRGFSKTMLCALASLWYADVYSNELKRPLEILLVSGQKRMYFHLNNFVRDNPDIKAKIVQGGMFKEIPENGFQLENGSIVDTCMATSKSIRGFRADILFVDEACLIKDTVWKALTPVLSGSICKLVVLSTPSEPSGFFVDLITDPEKYGFTLKQFSSEVCPWQQESNKGSKMRLSEAAYAREILARIPTSEEKEFLDNEALSRSFSKDIEPIASGISTSKIQAGIDPGYGKTNATGIIIVERQKERFKVLYALNMREFDPQAIATLMKQYRVTSIRMDNQPVEFHGLLEQHGLKPNYIEAQIYKDKILGEVKNTINLGHFKAPQNFKELYFELSHYHKGKTRNDNLVDALGLALCWDIIPEVKETPRAVVIANMNSGKVFNSLTGNTTTRNNRLCCERCGRIVTVKEDLKGRKVYCERCFDLLFGKKGK